MSSPRLFYSVLIVLSLNACGSSGGGGAGGAGPGGSGGSGGAAGQGTGGAAVGTGGTAVGTGGVGGSAGAAANGGAGGAGAAFGACGDSTGPSSGDTCNTLTANGNCVQEMVGTGNPPTAMGGTIVEGTYDLMTRKIYATSDAAVDLSSERNTIMISSVTPVSFVLDTLDESGSQITRAHGPVTVSGSTATFAPTCPTPGDGGDQGGSVTFTANGATLTIIESSSRGTKVSVYIKR